MVADLDDLLIWLDLLIMGSNDRRYSLAEKERGNPSRPVKKELSTIQGVIANGAPSLGLRRPQK